MKSRMLCALFSCIRATALSIADVVAPTDETIRAVERMNPEEFIKRIQEQSRADTTLTSRAEPSPAKDVVSIFPYRTDIAKAALVEIKDRPNRRIADVIGAALFAELLERLPELRRGEKPIVAPIPISKKKRRERGWNQCDLILDGFGKADAEGRFEIRKGLLAKVKDTEDQVGKSKAERFENLRGCFAVRDSAAIGDRLIIVVDDIVTTGATLGEAKRALNRAGARRVILVAVAH